MSRNSTIATVTGCCCAVALSSFLCWFLYQERQDSRAVTSSATAAVSLIAKQLTKNADGFDQTRAVLTAVVTEFTRPCQGRGDDPNKCGLLAQVKATAIRLGDAVVTTQLQVKNSQRIMNAAADALTGAAADVHSATIHADGAVDELQTDLDTGNRYSPVSGLNVAVAGWGETGTDFHKLLTDPDSNVNVMFANANGALGHFNHMAADSDLKWHALLFPPPCHSLGCHALQIVNGVRVAAGLVAPAADLNEMFRGELIRGTITVKQEPQP